VWVARAWVSAQAAYVARPTAERPPSIASHGSPASNAISLPDFGSEESLSDAGADGGLKVVAARDPGIGSGYPSHRYATLHQTERLPPSPCEPVDGIVVGLDEGAGAGDEVSGSNATTNVGDTPGAFKSSSKLPATVPSGTPTDARYFTQGRYRSASGWYRRLGLGICPTH
jgi:hypothetical protein